MKAVIKVGQKVKVIVNGVSRIDRVVAIFINSNGTNEYVLENGGVFLRNQLVKY